VTTTVELLGVNNELFTLAGDQAGDRGVWLATGVSGLFDPPVKVAMEEPGNYSGARYLNHRILRRDIVFGVHILDEHNDSWLSRESEWRKAWAFDRDCTLIITTDESGTRKLKLRLLESPEVDWTTDPTSLSANITKMVAVAGDPFWYGDDAVYSVKTKTDTRFDPVPFAGLFPWNQLPKETLTFKVDPSDGKGGLNPTDQAIWPKWTVPGSDIPIPSFPWPFPPNTPVPWERASFTQWMLPDYSFTDPVHKDRRIKLPGLLKGEDCVVDTDPRREQISSASGSPVWSRTNGVRWRHPIPAWTKSRTFVIDVSGAAPGKMVTLRLPRPWSRPWGMD